MIKLTSGEAEATVATLGAEARTWRVGAHELLWPGDPAIWHQISPILFPVCGWTRDGARVGGTQYALGLHGFAARLEFTLAERREDFVRLEAREDASTLAVYPFAFRLALEYRLTADSLGMAIEVANPSDAPMPYAAGLHPGFRWPFAGGEREGSYVEFAQDEDPMVPVMAPGGLIGKAKRRVPLQGRRLMIDDALFANDANCFLSSNSRSLTFAQANGASISMDFPGFPHVALWRRQGAPYLCLEPWTGYSDPEGFDGELSQKPSMTLLEPGGKARHEAVYWFTPPK